MAALGTPLHACPHGRHTGHECYLRWTHLESALGLKTEPFTRQLLAKAPSFASLRLSAPVIRAFLRKSGRKTQNPTIGKDRVEPGPERSSPDRVVLTFGWRGRGCGVPQPLTTTWPGLPGHREGGRGPGGPSDDRVSGEHRVRDEPGKTISSRNGISR